MRRQIFGNRKRRYGRGFLSSLRGQSTLEYAVLIAAVSAALIGMQLYVHRAIRANLRAVEIEVNKFRLNSETDHY